MQNFFPSSSFKVTKVSPKDFNVILKHHHSSDSYKNEVTSDTY